MPAWSFEPIGVIHTPFRERLSAPRQPAEAAGVAGEIELFSGKNFEHALSDIEGWSHLWVIFVFDRNEGWRPKVLPPRSGGRRRGVLATRAPYRPNPLGLSAVKLVGVDGLRLRVEGVDILDGSPVLDIKPYIPYTDSIPSASAGWLGSSADPGPRYEVSWSPGAAEQRAFLLGLGVDLGPAVDEVLAVSPHPHPYRRIRVEADGRRRLALKDWRVLFSVEGQRVQVERLATGYRAEQLAGPELVIHRAFADRFGLIGPKAGPLGYTRRTPPGSGAVFRYDDLRYARVRRGLPAEGGRLHQDQQRSDPVRYPARDDQRLDGAQAGGAHGLRGAPRAVPPPPRAERRRVRVPRVLQLLFAEAAHPAGGRRCQHRGAGQGRLSRVALRPPGRPPRPRIRRQLSARDSPRFPPRNG